MRKLSIGERVKIAREIRGWSQATLAEKAGIHAITISHLENGRHEPILAVQKALADAFGMTVEELNR